PHGRLDCNHVRGHRLCVRRHMDRYQYSQRLFRPRPRPMPEVSTTGCLAHPTAPRFSRPSGSVSDTGPVSSRSRICSSVPVIAADATAELGSAGAHRTEARLSVGGAIFLPPTDKSASVAGMGAGSVAGIGRGVTVA